MFFSLRKKVLIGLLGCLLMGASVLTASEYSGSLSNISILAEAEADGDEIICLGEGNGYIVVIIKGKIYYVEKPAN